MHFQMFDLFIAGLAHISLIATGVTAFALTDFKLKSQLENPPTQQLFLIFGIYGGLLLMILHSLTWPYSGMASLGFFATVVIAPIVGVHISYSLRRLRRESKSHQTLFVLGILYIPIAAILLGAILSFIMKLEDNI